MAFKGSLSRPGWESTAGINHRLAKLDDAAVLKLRATKNSVELATLADEYKISLGYADRVKRRLARKEVK